VRVFFAALFALVRLSGIRHGTTVPGPAAAWIPDILGRDFTASAPNQRYIGDMTYLLIKGSKPWYLATVIDLYA
jgi:transposase InsO family protein